MGLGAGLASNDARAVGVDVAAGGGELPAPIEDAMVHGGGEADSVLLSIEENDGAEAAGGTIHDDIGRGAMEGSIIEGETVDGDRIGVDRQRLDRQEGASAVSNKGRAVGVRRARIANTKIFNA